MATANTVDDLNFQSLKVEEPAKAEVTVATTEKPAKVKKEKPKQDKPKQEKPKQEKAKQEKPQVAAEAPPEELSFNRTPEEVDNALKQWTQQPLAVNQRKPGEKM